MDTSAILPRLSSLYFRREQIDRAIHALETFQGLRARRSHATQNALAVTKRFRSRKRAGNRRARIGVQAMNRSRSVFAKSR